MATKNFNRIVSLLAMITSAACANAGTRELPASEFRGTMITMTRGTVIAVDKATKKVSISHQGNWDLEIPAATTKFDLASTDMASDLAAGSAVFFIAAGDAKKPAVIRLAPRPANGFTY